MHPRITHPMSHPEGRRRYIAATLLRSLAFTPFLAALFAALLDNGQVGNTVATLSLLAAPTLLFLSRRERAQAWGFVPVTAPQDDRREPLWVTACGIVLRQAPWFAVALLAPLAPTQEAMYALMALGMLGVYMNAALATPSLGDMAKSKHHGLRPLWLLPLAWAAPAAIGILLSVRTEGRVTPMILVLTALMLALALGLWSSSLPYYGAPEDVDDEAPRSFHPTLGEYLEEAPPLTDRAVG